METNLLIDYFDASNPYGLNSTQLASLKIECPPSLFKSLTSWFNCLDSEIQHIPSHVFRIVKISIDFIPFLFDSVRSTIAGESEIEAACRQYFEGNISLTKVDNLGRSTLMQQIEKGEYGYARVFAHGSDLEQKEYVLFNTTLHTASGMGQPSLVQKLLSAGNRFNINEKNRLGDTPAHLAAAAGDATTLSILIDHGANLNATNFKGESVFIEAVKSGSTSCYDLLCKKSPKFDQLTLFGRNAIHYAVQLQSVHILNDLLGRGVEEVVDNEFVSPLHLAALSGNTKALRLLADQSKSRRNLNLGDKFNRTPAHLAAAKGHVEVIRLLDSLGAKLGQTDIKGWTPAHWAAYNGHADLISAIIHTYSTYVDQQDENKKTPLFLAAENGHLDAVNALLKYSNLSTTDESGKSVTYAAFKRAHHDIVALLLEAGAPVKAGPNTLPIHEALVKDISTDVTTSNKFENLQGANLNALDSDSQTPLMVALRSGKLGAAQDLIDSGCNVAHSDSKGVTAAHLCASYADHNLVKKLVKAGADFLAKDHRAQLPIHYAASVGNRATLASIVSHTARDARYDINSLDCDGNTPLCIAVSQGETTIIRDLLESFSANPLLMNNLRQTAFHKAAIQGDAQIMRMLIESRLNIFEGLDSPLNWRDHKSETPLFLARLHGHKKVEDLLLANQAQVYAADRDSLQMVLLNNNPEQVSQLLANKNALVEVEDKQVNIADELAFLMDASSIGAFVDRLGWAKLKAARDSLGRTLLHSAAAGNEPVFLSIAKMTKGDLVDEADNNKITPLHTVAERGDVNALLILAKLGANLNPIDVFGRTPLSIAASLNHKDFVERLEALGGLSAKNLDSASKKTEVQIKTVAFNTLAKNGNIDGITQLFQLGEVSINKNAKDHLGRTPLHMAVFASNSEEVIELLVKYGFDLRAKDKFGDTPLHGAVKSSNLKAVEKIRELSQ